MTEERATPLRARMIEDMATKTIRDTVSPYEMLARLQDQTVKRSLE